MNRNDIDRAFTAKVTELLAQGYQINPATMGGSQGEIAHVDLRRGSDTLRVLLESECGYGAAPDHLRLAVGRCTEELDFRTFRSARIIWNSRLEILSEIKFAKVTDAYFTDMETGSAIEQKRFHRWRAKKVSGRRELGDAYKSAALRYVRRQPRMKSCRLQDIESVTRVNRTHWSETLPDLYGYEIKAKGKTFMLLAPQPAQ